MSIPGFKCGMVTCLLVTWQSDTWLIAHNKICRKFTSCVLRFQILTDILGSETSPTASRPWGGRHYTLSSIAYLWRSDITSEYDWLGHYSGVSYWFNIPCERMIPSDPRCGCGDGVRFLSASRVLFPEIPNTHYEANLSNTKRLPSSRNGYFELALIELNIFCTNTTIRQARVSVFVL